MKRQSAFLFVIMCTSAPVQAQNMQFDLLCSGVMKTTTVGNKNEKPYSKTFRIDLGKAKWCENDCLALHDFSDVQPVQITFTDKEVNTLDEQSFTREFVNRQTGLHRAFSGARYPRFPELTISLEWEGRCSPQPFSGFTELKTQF